MLAHAVPHAIKGGGHAQAPFAQVCVLPQALPHEQSPLRIVTASFGLAWWAAPTSRLTPQAMYAQADAALYDAKRGGRDQIAIRCFLPGEGEQVQVPDGVR